MKKILVITTNTSTGVTYYRHYMPHLAFNKNHGFEIEEAQVGIDGIDRLSDADLKQYVAVLFMRHISIVGKTKQICERLRSLGIKSIFDMDDYWHLPEWHALYKDWKNKRLDKQTIDAFKYADLVFTTTPRMYNLIKTFNPNCYILFNSVFEEESQFKKRKIKNRRVRVGWVGGVFHYQDIRMIQNTFKLISQNKSLLNDIQVCYGGFAGQQEHFNTERIFTDNYSYIDKDYKDYLLSGTRMGEHIAFDKPYRRLWGMGVNQYVDMYNDLDICLAPIQNNDFNKGKSNLKIIEAGWMGKAIIASKVYPYTIDCNKENSILVSDNKYGWYEAILEYMDKDKRERHAANLEREIKSKYNVITQNEWRKKIYDLV